MKHLALTLVAVVLTVFSDHAPLVAEEIKDTLPPPPDGKTWKLFWNDEFDGDKLDETKWDIPPDAPRRDAWWMRKAISLDGGGNLVIRTFKDFDRYVDGCVRTLGRFEHSFGYYVARIKLQEQPGHWSAFWLMGPWLDERVQHALHWDGYGKEHRSSGKISEAPGVMKGFHTFSLFWSPEEYVFYVDGKETWRTSDGGVCQVPLYIKLSDEVGDWGGEIAEAELPDRFLVDYVRVYDLVDKE